MKKLNAGEVQLIVSGNSYIHVDRVEYIDAKGETSYQTIFQFTKDGEFYSVTWDRKKEVGTLTIGNFKSQTPKLVQPVETYRHVKARIWLEVKAGEQCAKNN